jgi:hypothetical protein
VSEKLDKWSLKSGGIDEDLRHQETKQMELMSSNAQRVFRLKQAKVKSNPGVKKLTEKTDALANSDLPHELESKSHRLSHGSARPAVLALSYYEDLDLLISGYEDSRISEFFQ